jgi:hypothetical protein
MDSAVRSSKWERNMITIASLLLTKTVGLRNPVTTYVKGRYAAFDGANLVATYPDGTSLDVAMASAEYENTGSSDALRELLTLEARDGNTEAAEFIKTRYAS